MITSAGSQHIEGHLLSRSVGSTARTSLAGADKHWKAAERKRLLTTAAFKKHNTDRDAELNDMDISQFFRIDAYMSDEACNTKLDRFVNAFRSDKRLGRLVTILAQRAASERQSKK
jgi:hypothetical protein